MFDKNITKSKFVLTLVLEHVKLIRSWFNLIYFLQYFTNNFNNANLRPK